MVSRHACSCLLPTMPAAPALIIASDLKKVGIELELINVEWAQWLSNVFKGKDYDLTIISHTEPDGHWHLCP